MEQKIFFVTGEVSGDSLASWYINKKQYDKENVYIEAIGGVSLKEAGVKIYKNIHEFSAVGFFEIFHKVPYFIVSLFSLTSHIINNNFQEVVLVDFPGFNLLLAKILKRKKPTIKITYLSPPQVWCWGKWRIKSIKKYCNNLIVLYPFEVNWYEKYGIKTNWMGSPVYQRVKPYFLQENAERENKIAILIGSRKQEIIKLSPIIKKVMLKIIAYGFNGTFLIPIADPALKEIIKKSLKIKQNHLLDNKIIFTSNEEKKYTLLSSCCLAISKPGTITLELALLGIPTVLFYKTSYLTYILAKKLVYVKYMALPNLLLKNPIYKEFIQKDCTVTNIANESWKIYKMFYEKKIEYTDQIKKLLTIRSTIKEN